MLNGGSYIGIPKSIRTEVGLVCERFIQDHIAAGKDFATETTLRSTLALDQMKQAHDAGVAIRFRYVCVDSIGTAVTRVKQPAFLGGHSRSAGTVQAHRTQRLPNPPR